MIPTNNAFAQGVAVVSGNQFNSFTQNCNTAAQLRTFVGLPTMYVLLGGISVVGDGSGGVFYWNASANGVDDNYNVIVPYGSGIGAWVRLTTIASFAMPTVYESITDIVMTPAMGILEVNASAGNIMVTVPLFLGTTLRLIEKIDTTENLIFVSSDGINPIDVINTPASSAGKVNGWRFVNSIGSALRSFGAG